MFKKLKYKIGKKIYKYLKIYKKDLFNNTTKKVIWKSVVSENARVNEPCQILESSIDDGTYISPNCFLSKVKLGKFCSVGPNLNAGYGIHPTNGISTSPAFYSTRKQNGKSFVSENKIEERKEIIIGNDVFIGINVTILDGIKIGDGAIIAAGAVVTADVPPYAIVGGVPAKIIKYRFNDSQIKDLENIKWWDWNDEDLKKVAEHFFDIDKFINYAKNKKK